ncbi:hypothetical protein F5Y12DRAFT_742227 [Xylaria sp. FL1777]|nr:hypothetical protein F5Y12DRAFT_742227 [Xylaria sp. FL1777]
MRFPCATLTFRPTSLSAVGLVHSPPSASVSPRSASELSSRSSRSEALCFSTLTFLACLALLHPIPGGKVAFGHSLPTHDSSGPRPPLTAIGSARESSNILSRPIQTEPVNMPIGDLLAEISGGQPSSAPSPKSAGSSGIKRKAEDGSNGATSTKLTKARQPDGSYSTSKVTRDAEGRVVERSYSVSRPVKAAGSGHAALTNSSTLPHRTSSPSTNGRHDPPAPTSQRMASVSNGKLPATSSSTAQPKRFSEVASRPKLNQPASTTTKMIPPKRSPTTPTPSDPSRAPKKGSFKEIMARGAKAQEVMGKVGMIQHKSTDKATSKKERDTAKPEQKPGVGSGAKGKINTPYAGTGRPSGGRDNGPVGPSARTVPRNGPTKDTKTGNKLKPGSAANDAAEKKVKKSATATTGYAGTARPRPGTAANKGPSSRGDQRPRHGGLLEPPRMSRRNRYEEEYDEDLDDFIDYDDEEEQDMGPRYDYDSEGSSDMEAGMSDIDTEERRAELYAREEDKREQALEEKLKKEKEERKRRWAQGGR